MEWRRYIEYVLPAIVTGCDCDCRKRPIRQLLNTLIGSTVNILVSNGSTATNFNIEQTGLGIVFGTLLINDDTLVKFAISICKITAVGQTIYKRCDHKQNLVF